MKQIENKISNNTIILKHVKMENNDTIIKISTPDPGPAHLTNVEVKGQVKSEDLIRLAGKTTGKLKNYIN